MPTARQILDLLTRDELLHLAAHHDVTVDRRRQKVDLAERLGQMNPNASLVGDLPMRCPPLVEQRAISDILFALDQRLRLERARLAAANFVEVALTSVLTYRRYPRHPDAPPT